MNLELEGKVVLVTGSTSGIGQAIAEAFANEGAHVMITGRDPKVAQSVADELAKAGGKTHFLAGDLMDATFCQALVAATVERFGRIDVLVNNAGINDGISLEEGTIDQFLASLQRNVLHFFALTKYALPYLRQSVGNIVNIGSKIADTGQGGTSGYAASKGAVRALTREWAISLRNYGIRVNEVIPAEVLTTQYQNWLNSLPDPIESQRKVENLIPLGKRFTTAQEIADMVLFVSSARASHITGQHLFVDGGYTHLDRAITAPGLHS